ncbi:MAG TPA: GNAT family N-acetyltransferase [Paracoccaceae bacterium]|nr:GNAT family N-acetyltransferase [Paracoccaceae bacterium]
MIRPYLAADRAACHRIFHPAVHQGAARAYTADQRAAWAPSDQRDPAQPDRFLDQFAFVAEVSGTPAGFMTLDKTGCLDMAFVLPEVMGTGVADALYAAILSTARAERFSRLTTAASHLARAFFARHGWQPDQEETHPLRGQLLPRFAMSLDLTQPADRA